MDDVTDFVFREIVCLLAKPDVLFTEFTSSDSLFSRGRERVLRKLKYSETQRPIVAQIWGSTPEYFYKAAKDIRELGFDGIDINMGCPDRGVTKKKAGSYLITDKILAGELIYALKEGAGDMAVSVKTRLSPDETPSEEWFSFLLNQNIDGLIIHGRTARANSKGNANWAEIAGAVKLRDLLSPQTVVVGNGDVKSYSEVLDKHKTFGVDGVMIGRGIFSDPWIFDKNLNPAKHTVSNHLDILLQHTKLYVETWENEKNFEVMKKFFKMYINNFKGADKLRQSLMSAKNFEQVETIIKSFLESKAHPISAE